MSDLELNPATGRYRKKCLPTQERNKTGKCVKKCVPPQVRDPVTNRCINPRPGRRIPVVAPVAPIVPVEDGCAPNFERNAKGKCVKKCVPPQVRNPSTQRCKKPVQPAKAVRPAQRVKPVVRKPSFFEPMNLIEEIASGAENTPRDDIGLKTALEGSTSDVTEQDICIGHAMATTYGQKVQDIRREVISAPDLLVFPHIYDYMISSLSPNFVENKILSFESDNISGHSTRINMYKNDGKTYIWYVNPWGFMQDFDRTTNFEFDFMAGPLQDMFDKALYDRTRDLKSAMSVSPEDVDKMGRPPLGSPAHIAAYSVVRIKQYAKEFHRKSFDKTVAWNRRIKGPHQHVMSMIYLLKLIIEKDRQGFFDRDRKVLFEVLHPRESMPPQGVQIQTRDGNEGIIRQCGKVRLGACVVWSELYTEWASLLLGSVSKSKDGIYKALYKTLPNIGHMTTREARYMLGRFYFHHVTTKLVEENYESLERAGVRGLPLSVKTMLLIFEVFYASVQVRSGAEKERTYSRVINAHTKAMDVLSGIDALTNVTWVMMNFFDDVGMQSALFGEVGTIYKRYVEVVINTCVILVGCKHDVYAK